MFTITDQQSPLIFHVYYTINTKKLYPSLLRLVRLVSSSSFSWQTNKIGIRLFEGATVTNTSKLDPALVSSPIVENDPSQDDLLWMKMMKSCKKKGEPSGNYMKHCKWWDLNGILPIYQLVQDFFHPQYSYTWWFSSSQTVELPEGISRIKSYLGL